MIWRTDPVPSSNGSASKPKPKTGDHNMMAAQAMTGSNAIRTMNRRISDVAMTSASGGLSL
jgi:hypothetical protein